MQPSQKPWLDRRGDPRQPTPQHERERPRREAPLQDRPNASRASRRVTRTSPRGFARRAADARSAERPLRAPPSESRGTASATAGPRIAEYSERRDRSGAMDASTGTSARVSSSSAPACGRPERRRPDAQAAARLSLESTGSDGGAHRPGLCERCSREQPAQDRGQARLRLVVTGPDRRLRSARRSATGGRLRRTRSSSLDDRPAAAPCAPSWHSTPMPPSQTRWISRYDGGRLSLHARRRSAGGAGR